MRNHILCMYTYILPDMLLQFYVSEFCALCMKNAWFLFMKINVQIR